MALLSGIDRMPACRLLRGVSVFHCSAIKTFFTGSVSSYVLKHAYCPVLISKGVPDDWDEEDMRD